MLCNEIPLGRKGIYLQWIKVLGEHPLSGSLEGWEHRARAGQFAVQNLAIYVWCHTEQAVVRSGTSRLFPRARDEEHVAVFRLLARTAAAFDSSEARQSRTGQARGRV